MKKLLVIALLLVCGFSLFAANNAARTNLDISSAVYLNTGEFGVLDLGIFEGDAAFVFAMNGDVSVIAKEGFGGYAQMGFQLPGYFNLYTAGAYKLKLNKDINLMVTAGPTFQFGRNYFTFGADILAHFDYQVVKNWFLRLSLGLDMDFFTNDKQGNKLLGFCMEMQLPMVAIGYSF